MALKLRGDTWWMDVTIRGERIRESLRTGDKKEAQELHDIRRSELWRMTTLKEAPKKTFDDACDRWLKERAHKRSLGDDKDKIDGLFKPKLGKKLLAEITRDKIEEILPQDVKPATRNRYRALARAILRACWREWDWLNKIPAITNEPEPDRRVAFLTREQAENLVSALPEKYRIVVRFALLTGLRKSNVVNLQWENVSLERSTVVVHADEAKGKSRIVVPLNSQAKALLESIPQEARQGRVWADVKDIWGTTWKDAAKRAGVPWCRFHDLRHTWASWHAMAGTPTTVLQELGGWKTAEMVRKYAHLSPEHLAAAAEKVTL